MKITIYKIDNEKIAEISSPSILLTNAQDLLDLVSDPELDGSRKIILSQANLIPDFFELKTGVAGAITQKLVNYQLQLAIIGDFENIESKSLKAWIVECNRGNTIFFVENIEMAKKFLANRLA